MNQPPTDLTEKMDNPDKIEVSDHFANVDVPNPEELTLQEETQNSERDPEFVSKVPEVSAANRKQATEPEIPEQTTLSSNDLIQSHFCEEKEFDFYN